MPVERIPGVFERIPTAAAQEFMAAQTFNRTAKILDVVQVKGESSLALSNDTSNVCSVAVVKNG